MSPHTISRVLSIASVLVAVHVFSIELIDGHSMEPTLSPGTLVLAMRYRLAWGTRDPRRGQLVIVKQPLSEQAIIKRIVGLPFDCVDVDDGITRINGVAVPEPYVSRDNWRRDYGRWCLGPRQYIVLGDNRRASSDSREFGAVSSDRIVARVLLAARVPGLAWAP